MARVIFAGYTFSLFSLKNYLIQFFLEVSSTHILHHKEDMVLILETKVQSRDEGMTRCQHEGFLSDIISQIMLEVLRRFFIALIA
jgi:hypothetical protein